MIEETFDLREIIVKVLRKWRLLVVFAALFGLVLGGYGLSSEQTKFAEKQAELAKTQAAAIVLAEQRQSELKTQKFETEGKISSAEQKVQYSRELLSCFDQVDAKKSYAVEYFVLANIKRESMIAAQIADICVAIGSDTAFYAFLSSKYGGDIPFEYLKELVAVYAFDPNPKNADLLNSISENVMFSIRVRGQSLEFCATMANDVLEYITRKLSAIETIRDSYTLEQINSGAEPTPNQDLFNRKIAIQNEIQENLTNISNYKEELKKFEKEVKELNEPMEEQLEAPSRRSVLKSAALYAGLGAIVGLGLCVLWLFFADMMAVRVSDCEEVSKRYKLKCLIKFDTKSKKRFFSFVDRWIDRLDGSAVVKLTEKESFEVLRAKLFGILEDKTNQKILFTGDIGPECLTRLVAGLPELACLCAGNVTSSAECIKCANESAGVVLVVSKNNSTYPSLEKQLEGFRDIDKDILGFVMV